MIYLNNAATSYPKPEAVYAAVDRTLRQNPATAGRTSGDAQGAEDNLERCRLALKKLVNFPGDHNRIIFTQNATDSLHLVYGGFLEEGDHIVRDGTCHNSLLRPLEEGKKSHDFEVTEIGADEEGFLDLEELEKSITEKTKLVAITHASNGLGTVQDLEKISKICMKNGAALLLDASQTLGKFPIDLEKNPVDFLVAPGHKSLFGPTGTGVLYVGEDVDLKPIRTGGTGSFSEDPLQPRTYPYKLESGTHNMIGVAGLRAGVEWVLENSVEKIHDRELALTKRLRDGLGKIAGVEIYGVKNVENSVSVVACNLAGYEPGEVGQILEESFDIICRTGFHCAPWPLRYLKNPPKNGTVRFSPSFFTTEEEIDRTIEAVGELMG